MTGTWLTALGRRMTREETFDRLLSPAISDLQIEYQNGASHRWLHYSGFALVLIHALVHDLRLDVSFAFGSDARRCVWRRAAIWYLAFAVFLTYIAFVDAVPWMFVPEAIWPQALISASIEAFIASFAPGLTAAVVYLYRTTPSRRSISVAVLVVALLTAGLSLTAMPVRMSAERTIHAAVGENIDATNDRWGRGWLETHADKLDERFMTWRAIQSGVGMIPVGLMGLILGRRRGWNVVGAVAGIFLTWTLFVMMTFRIRQPFESASRIGEYWSEMALTTSVIITWLIADALKGRLWPAALNRAR